MMLLHGGGRGNCPRNANERYVIDNLDVFLFEMFGGRLDAATICADPWPDQLPTDPRPEYNPHEQMTQHKFEG